MTYRHDDAEYTDIRTQSFAYPGRLPEYADHTTAPRRKRCLSVNLRVFVSSSEGEGFWGHVMEREGQGLKGQSVESDTENDTRTWK